MSQQEMPKMEYPVMLVQATPRGMLLSILKSQFEKQEIFVAAENVVQFFVDFVPMLPVGTKQDMLREISKREKGKLDIQRAIANPKGIDTKIWH